MSVYVVEELATKSPMYWKETFIQPISRLSSLHGRWVRGRLHV